MNCTGELKVDGLQLYQEQMFSLRWLVEIGRVDILLETAIFSKHLSLLLEGHLEQVFHIIGYLNNRKKLRLIFNSEYPATDKKLFNNYGFLDFYRMRRNPYLPTCLKQGYMVSLSHVLLMLTTEGILRIRR